MNLPSRVPGEIVSYDADARLARVKIPGIADGTDVYPEAQFEYPIGDDSRRTEIRILPGDLVWLAFENGDRRFPIITGYRNPRTGNDTEWRRWAHQNIELEADEVIHLKGKRLVIDMEDGVEINTKVITATATESIGVVTPTLSVTAETAFNGNVNVTGTVAASVDVTAGGVSGKDHLHGGVDSGSDQTSPPVP